MATGSAGDGFIFRCACLSGSDPVVSRRPYHKNCKCPLHEKNGTKSCSDRNLSRQVSYPIRRSWSESCLVVAPSACGSNVPSPSLSPSFSALNMVGIDGGGSGKAAGIPPVPDRHQDDDADDLFFVSRV